MVLANYLPSAHPCYPKTEKSICVRGLEKLSLAGSLQARSRRQFCVTIVLEEQEDQRSRGIDDKVRIAQLCTEFSARSKLVAIARGRSDAESTEAST